ncbi:serine/threonine-protein kinase [Nonomuraea sp. NPDC049750]|uniref:serine/threonine-protein kinase n=1 Tax=Nonomuraea sp. NPDC049750 TaxID=3154738 RepID=UPI0033F0987F
MEWNAPGYTEIKQLGAGGSGRVVLAVHDETGVKVAIKYLSQRLLSDPVALARFQSEARLLTTLRDQNIATLWEYIQDGYGAAIVMELVNGVSLRALLREHGTTGPEAALAVLKGSLLGLARAHSHGLVHKDYKPENVIVRDDGASKLVDFGIAVQQGTASRAEGTPPYMAPELWENMPASPATDVYAATAVFFECLTGHRPYRSTEPSVLGYQHMHAPIPVHDAPEPVRELITRGMAKDPAARPVSAAAFVIELEAAARAAYGEDWEERGRRRLAGLVALLALLLPVPQTPPAEVTTSLAQTVFRTTLRTAKHNAARLAMGVGVVAVATIAVIVVLSSRDQAVEVALARPSQSQGPAEEGSPPATPVTLSQPPEESPVDLPRDQPTALAVASPSPKPHTAEPVVATSPPTTKPAPTPKVTVTKPVKPTPTVTKPGKPTPTPGKPTPTKTPKPPKTITPTPVVTVTTPTVTPTPVPVTSVAGLTLGGLTFNDDNVAGSTLSIRTTGTGRVTATAAWSVGGVGVRSQTLRLSGDRSYDRALSYTADERPCGKTVTLAVTTFPAAPGGARTATVNVPPCPTRVTGLRASLDLAASPGRTAQARVRVTTSGTAEVPVEAAFALNGDQVATRSATLSGRTAYSRTFTYAFRSRPCDTTVSVVVRAGDRTATARTRVTCPPSVRKVSIVRASLSPRGPATAVVAVTTDNDQPVRLSVAFSLGGRIAHTETLTLSGDTSYTRTVSYTFDKVPCGTSWLVTAATRPTADNGGDSSGGKTAACQEDPPTDDDPPKDDPPKDDPTKDGPKTPAPDTPSDDDSGTIG